MMEDVNWTALSFGLSALAMAGNVFCWIYVHIARRRAATEQQVRELEARMIAAEQAIRAAPTLVAWNEVSLSIAGIAGDVRTSAAEIRGLGAGLKRVESQIALLMENELRGKG